MAIMKVAHEIGPVRWRTRYGRAMLLHSLALSHMNSFNMASVLPRLRITFEFGCFNEGLSLSLCLPAGIVCCKKVVN